MNLKQQKQNGFNHEKIIVIPQEILHFSMSSPLTNSLFLTDIGYFPNAKDHFRERKDGCAHYIFLFCVEGKGQLIVNGQEMFLEKNQVYVIPPNVPHLYQADEKSPWSLYWFHYDGVLAESFYQWVFRKSFILDMNASQHGQILQDFEQMYRVLKTGYSFENILQISALFFHLFTILSQSNFMESPFLQVQKNPVSCCIDHMQSKVYQSISLKDLCFLTNLSESYLISIFKEQTGFSPIDYYLHLKIQRSCTLLDSTSKTIKEIAQDVGYHDPYYFSRIFKKIMHLSPKQYRMMKKG